ncbi:G patch domain-containing protein [Arachis hypogaea]|nr:G patch domain-containing protein [Arachis hypogaea]
MDYRWTNGRQDTGSGRDRRQHKRDQAYQDSSVENSLEDFRLPINHRPTENVDLENVEQASLDTQLTSSNIGFKLLQKMGWKGKGLGKDEQGIIEPIKSGMRDPRLGVGKQEEDDFFTAEENIQRRKLDIELEETEENVRKREKAAYTIYACLLTGLVCHKEPSTLEDLENFLQFYYLVASSALLRAHYENSGVSRTRTKIQTEVKEIRKVFYCELCNKQYKLAMEFEAHLSSYDHNHRKRFKQMKEMHGGSSRDDRQKREQQRQEKEMAKFAQMADAQKQQRLQLQQESGSASASSGSKTATALTDQEQRNTLKFGFSSKGTASKVSVGIKKPNIAKKKNVPISSIFGNDSDEE